MTAAHGSFSSRTWRAAPLLGAVALWLLIYLPDVGRGFIKDDFAWIDAARRLTPRSLLFDAPTGFFRPVVTLSFAADYALAGSAPLVYGLTNLLLALVCGVLVARLVEGAGGSRWAAAFGAVVWGFNFHGINLALLWISGRTSLLATLGVLLAMVAWLRGARVVATAAAVAAMLSKEDALVLPALAATTVVLLPPPAGSPGRGLARSWGLWVVLLATLALRHASGAMTPFSAPEHYRYAIEGRRVALNVGEYLDRSLTTAALSCLAVWLLAGRPRVRFTPGERRRLLWGAAWWTLTLLPTVLLPVRSSLYVVLPSVAGAVAAGVWADAVRRAAAPRRRDARLAVGLLLIVVALLPVYKLRNRRLVGEGVLSTEVLAQVRAIDGVRGVVRLRDDRTVRPSAEQAFGAFAEQAARLVSDGRLGLWITPRPVDVGEEGVEPDPATVVAELSLVGGRVRRER